MPGFKTGSFCAVNHQQALGAASEETRISLNLSLEAVLALQSFEHIILDSGHKFSPLGQQGVSRWSTQGSRTAGPTAYKHCLR